MIHARDVLKLSYVYVYAHVHDTDKLKHWYEKWDFTQTSQCFLSSQKNDCENKKMNELCHDIFWSLTDFAAAEVCQKL